MSRQFSVYRGDPLAVLLHDRLSLSAVSLGILALVGSGLVIGASVVVFALAFPEGTLQDFVTWLCHNWEEAAFWGLTLPLVIGFYGWINTGTGNLLSALKRDRVFDWSDTEFERVLYEGHDSLDGIYNHRVWTGAAIATTLLVWVATMAGQVWMGPFGGPDPLGEKLWAYVLIGQPMLIVGAYMVCMIAAKEFATIYCLRRLFQSEAFRLVPLHPDGCGGLQALSRYALRFGYFLGVAGFGLAVMSIQSLSIGSDHFAQDYPLHFGLGLYVILAPLTFFGTVGTAHARMEVHKRELLLWVSSLFDKTHTDVVEAMKLSRQPEDTTLAEIDHLHSLYRTVEGFPVWPFDMRTIRNFSAVVLAPVLTVAVSTAISVLVESS